MVIGNAVIGCCAYCRAGIHRRLDILRQRPQRVIFPRRHRRQEDHAVIVGDEQRLGGIGALQPFQIQLDHRHADNLARTLFEYRLRDEITGLARDRAEPEKAAGAAFDGIDEIRPEQVFRADETIRAIPVARRHATPVRLDDVGRRGTRVRVQVGEITVRACGESAGWDRRERPARTDGATADKADIRNGRACFSARPSCGRRAPPRFAAMCRGRVATRCSTSARTRRRAPREEAGKRPNAASRERVPDDGDPRLWHAPLRTRLPYASPTPPPMLRRKRTRRSIRHRMLRRFHCC